ncbi:MAG: hypothetical protein JHC95_17870 [Solirubrobacteraceae bacterium]|nr:hypothetical protein [Solirubrobacteraceae bacterium]
MNATTSPEAAFGGAPGGGPKVLRSVGSCFGWLLLSYGLWGFSWIYNTLNDIGEATGKDTNAVLKTVLYIVPFVNFVVLFLVWKDVDDFLEETGAENFNLVLYFIGGLIPIVNIFIWISIQNKLNAGWVKRTNGAAEEADLGTLGLVTVVIGALFWVVWLIVILAGVAFS